MKVFIVSEACSWEPERIVAIFDSEQKARHFVEDNTRERISHYIEEWEVM